MEGVVNKKYLRVPPFLFQSPPPNYITAVGRNALGLNKKKLTVDDIRNLKAKKQKKVPGIQAGKGNKQDKVIQDDGLSVLNRKRTASVLEEEQDKPKVVKKTTLFDDIDWLNIPEAKKMTSVDKASKKEEVETINKFSTLDKIVKKSTNSGLMDFMDNSTDWKQEISTLLSKKTESGDIVKILNRSLKYALKEYKKEDLKFHLESILSSTDKMHNDSIALETILSHADSILRYSVDSEIIILTYKALKKMKLNSKALASFLKRCIAKKSDNYAEIAMCLREMYLLESEELEDDSMAKKTLLSEYLYKYGEDVIDLLYESVIIDMENTDNVKELIEKRPLVQWEEFLNKEIYIDEEAELDDFAKYFVHIVIEKRYNKGNLNNFKNILGKFQLNMLKMYINEQILKRDLSTNIWEYHFNQELANNKNIGNTIKLIEDVIQDARNIHEEKMRLINLFVEKYCYNGNKTFYKYVQDFVNKHSDLDVHMIYHQLKIQRRLDEVHETILCKFEQLQNKEQKFEKLEYCLEYIDWIHILGSKIKTQSLEELYLSSIHFFAKNTDINTLKCGYYKYLVENKERTKAHDLVVEDLTIAPLNLHLVDVLILCMDKGTSEVIFNKWTLFYKNLLIKHPSERTTILFILQKLLYRKIFFDLEAPNNVKLINEFLTFNKIDSSMVKDNSNLGLIVSLMLKLELLFLKKSQNRNYQMLLKSTLKKYLSDYDNNYLILYQIAYELKDCKWLMNSIKKNSVFENPYKDLLSSSDHFEKFSNYTHTKDLLVNTNMKSIHCPNVRFIEFSDIYRL